MVVSEGAKRRGICRRKSPRGRLFGDYIYIYMYEMWPSYF
jgi:hypothetical protein